MATYRQCTGYNTGYNTGYTGTANLNRSILEFRQKNVAIEKKMKIVVMFALKYTIVSVKC